jgi:hypothetical protein
MTVVNEDAFSTAANGIATLRGIDLLLRTSARSIVTLVYDATASRWSRKTQTDRRRSACYNWLALQLRGTLDANAEEASVRAISAQREGA